MSQAVILTTDKNLVRESATEGCAVGAAYSFVFSLVAGGIAGVSLQLPIIIVFCAVLLSTLVGGVIGGVRGRSVARKALRAPADTRRINELLAVRNEIEGEIGELEDRRHKFDRELAALTSDEFVEEFVRDKPFPAPPPPVVLLPEPRLAPSNVSEDYDPTSPRSGYHCNNGPEDCS